jgi:hypothetical protein
MRRGRQIIRENPDLEWDMHREIVISGVMAESLIYGNTNKPNKNNKTIQESLIDRFKDKRRAILLIEKLIKLESLSEGLLLKAEGEIEKLIELAEIITDEQAKKTSNPISD